MKKIIVLAMCFLLAATVLSVAAAGNQPEKVRVFLEFNGKPNVGLVNLAGGKVLHDYGFVDNVLVIEVPVVALNGILKNPNVVGHEFDVEVHTLAPPGACSPWPSCKGGEDPTPDPDPEPSQEVPWGVDRIDADLTTVTGQGATVCIVDTGVDKDHPDLQVAGGKNFVRKGKTLDPSKWDDDNGHGTHVAGTVAALDNSIGVVGVAPEATLLAAKVLDKKGSGYLSDVVSGIEYCVGAGADVISMSLGASVDVSYMKVAVDAAYAQGVLLVAAAGNEYSSPVIFPAAYDSVIAVSATDSNDQWASFNNVGPEVELAAPGVNVLSTWKGGGLNVKSGTSMATPHVSGVAALAIASDSTLSVVDVRNLLQTTADDLGATGWDPLFGWGLVDAELI